MKSYLSIIHTDHSLSKFILIEKFVLITITTKISRSQKFYLKCSINVTPFSIGEVFRKSLRITSERLPEKPESAPWKDEKLNNMLTRDSTRPNAVDARGKLSNNFPEAVGTVARRTRGGFCYPPNAGDATCARFG